LKEQVSSFYFTFVIISRCYKPDKTLLSLAISLS